ncbi:MAG: hypothetical protein RIQ53_3912 [Pseudomonadota bacterium]|jgi:predicted metalloprotease with PDZ domain
MPAVRHHVEIDDLHTHHWRVTLTLEAPAAEQEVSFPVWIPGSYLVREFGRHLSDLTASQGGQPRAVEQLDKARWRVRCRGRGALVLRYRVYAYDNSVRASWLDAWRGFFNPTSLLLLAEGRRDEPQALTLGRLPAGWEVATAMPPAPAESAATARSAPARGRRAAAVQVGDLPPQGWLCADYDALADHPVELGSFWRGRFTAGGVPHEFVVAGAKPRFDGERLLRDVQKICEAQIRFWHGDEAPPFERYVFLLNAVEDGYGGLEHRASTALICNRRDLPVAETDAAAEGYVTLLGLISHEYFHTWNVKRLKPAEFARYDYGAENYTELLWFFEGFTSYYDDLFLRRCGLIDAPHYLKLIARTVNAVAAVPGRRVQSVAQASFDAWTKYYRQDENTLNATVSYYQKGALVALAFDLLLRRHGGTLDDAMRALWASSQGGPVTEADIVAAFEAQAGRPLADEVAAWVHGTAELPLAELLAEQGVDLGHERRPWTAALGLKLAESPLSGVQVKQVAAGSAAARAGLAVGDELLAVDGWRVRRFEDSLAWTGRDQPVRLLLARDQRIHECRLQPPAADDAARRQATLKLADKPGRALARRRRDWIDA